MVVPTKMSTELPNNAEQQGIPAAHQKPELESPDLESPAPRVSDIQQALWQFSLAFYPKQQALLLQLQDELGAQVNLILAICWLATQHRQLTPVQLHACTSAIASTQQTLIQPLRQIRRNLTASTLHFKTELLALELKAEQQEQAEIAAYVAQHWSDLPETLSAQPALQNYFNGLNSLSTLITTAAVDLDQAIASYSSNVGHSLI